MRPAGNEAGANSLDPPARHAVEGFSFANLPQGAPRCNGQVTTPSGQEVLNMTIQSQHAAARRSALRRECADVSAHRALLCALILAGARGAAPAAVTAALMRYWQELRLASVTQRRWVIAELHAAVRRGETTSRAWLPVAVGETDPGLVREAVLGYLGGTPVSIERRELALGDALDWIRRGLALNRVAVFVALLQLGDVTINERLAGLRGRLNDAEAAAVWRAFADCDGTPGGDFIAEWRTFV